MRVFGVSFGIAALAACIVVVPAGASRRLTASDRSAISATLDVFVNHAVKRQDVGASYGVIAPELRSGMSRKAWSRGSIPVYPYPARGVHHPWTLDYVTNDEVGVDLLLLPPRGSKTLGPIAFKVYLRPSHGRWLVDSFMPVATFAPLGAKPTVRALPDFSPQPQGDRSNPTGRGRIRTLYIAFPFAFLGLTALALAAWGLVRGVRNRPRRGSLPPSPIRDA